jgi:RNA polymerase sigma-70 factor (ECF subfamily)
VPTLVEAFVAKAPEPQRAQLAVVSADTLASEVGRLCEAGQAAWPELAVDAARFAAYAAARLDVETGDPLAALGALRPGDLYLACACALGVPHAVDAFERTHGAAIRAALLRAGAGDHADDVAQTVRAKLFVGTGEATLAIVKYAGRGSLGSWAQVMAVRELRSRARRVDPLRPTDDMDAIVERTLHADDEEMRVLKSTYRAEFKRAFERAFERLTPKQRNLLRLECIDGLNIDEIGVVYGVHRATVARWRSDARAVLLKETRRVFVEELKLRREEFDSIMRLIESQADVSLPRLLRDDAEPK